MPKSLIVFIVLISCVMPSACHSSDTSLMVDTLLSKIHRQQYAEVIADCQRIRESTDGKKDSKTCPYVPLMLCQVYIGGNRPDSVRKYLEEARKWQTRVCDP